MQRERVLELVTGKGIKGDQAFGRKSRQVLLIDLDQLRALHLNPGDMRENITIEGIPIDSLPIGTRLVSGDVVIRVVSACDPCTKLETLRPGLMDESEGVRGMLAIVEQGGSMQEGHRIDFDEGSSDKES